MTDELIDVNVIIKEIIGNINIVDNHHIVDEIINTDVLNFLNNYYDIYKDTSEGSKKYKILSINWKSLIENTANSDNPDIYEINDTENIEDTPTISNELYIKQKSIRQTFIETMKKLITDKIQPVVEQENNNISQVTTGGKTKSRRSKRTHKKKSNKRKTHRRR